MPADGSAATPSVSTTTIEIDQLTKLIPVRATLNQETVTDYAEALMRGDKLPPPVVYELTDGSLHVADGRHRIEAAKARRAKTIACVVIPGTIEEATLAAVRANASHGLRRTNADKRACVRALRSLSSWSTKSHTAIAEACGVDDKTAKSVLDEMVAETVRATAREKSGSEVPSLSPAKITTKDGKTRKATTTRPKKTPPAPTPVPAVVSTATSAPAAVSTPPVAEAPTPAPTPAATTAAAPTVVSTPAPAAPSRPTLTDPAPAASPAQQQLHDWLANRWALDRQDWAANEDDDKYGLSPVRRWAEHLDAAIIDFLDKVDPPKKKRKPPKSPRKTVEDQSDHDHDDEDDEDDEE